MLLIVVVAAVDSVHRYRQTPWHVRRVPLTCQVITMRWAGDVVLLCCGWCHRRVPWRLWVVEQRLWEVGGGGDARLVKDVEMETVCLYLT